MDRLQSRPLRLFMITEVHYRYQFSRVTSTSVIFVLYLRRRSKMKKAKDGATKRLRIASCMCLLFMIVEFVGKNLVLFSLLYIEN